MSGPFRTPMAIATALLLVTATLPACRPCDDYTCDLQTIDPQTAEAGSVATWNGESMALGSGDISEGNPPPLPGTCYAMFGQYPGSTLPASGDAPSWELFVTLRCTRLDGPGDVSFGAVVGDLAAPETGPAPVQARGWYNHDGSGAVDDDFTYEAMLTVEESVGTRASLPEMVTPDFKRVIRFDLAAGQAIGDQPDLGATLRFTLTAQHFHYWPDARCSICS